MYLNCSKIIGVTKIIPCKFSLVIAFLTLILSKKLTAKFKISGEVYYQNDSNISGQVAWEQSYHWINKSKIVLVLITGNAVVRAISVGIEEVYKVHADFCDEFNPL